MPKRSDKTTTIQDLKDAFVQFRDERGWRRHHTPRNLASSISIEAAELLEHFQWEDYSDQDKEAIASELADIINYCVDFAEVMDIDITQAFFKKLDKVKKKYPVEIFNPAHDDKAAYHHIKQTYRKGKK